MSVRPMRLNRPRPLYATCDTGLEEVLAAELEAIGALDVCAGHRGVHFSGDRTLMWKANLCCRIANRILLPIAQFPAPDEQSLYNGIKRIDWAHWLTAKRTLAVDASTHKSKLTHNGFVALKAKDAICDRMRDDTGQRPSIDKRRAQVPVNLRIDRDTCIVSLDSSGARLHRRGYRIEAGEAPLKETLAAGVLALAGWDGTRGLVDPMCGAGTFVVEAALIAANIPPGLLRLGNKGFAFQRWNDHDEVGFDALVATLDAKIAPDGTELVPILGSDMDAAVLKRAWRNVKRAGVGEWVELKQCSLDEAAPPTERCVVVANPPYGERMGGGEAEVEALYNALGATLKANFQGTDAWIIYAAEAPGGAFKMKANVRIKLQNGSIPCKLAHFETFKAGERAGD